MNGCGCTTENNFRTRTLKWLNFFESIIVNRNVNVEMYWVTHVHKIDWSSRSVNKEK